MRRSRASLLPLALYVSQASLTTSASCVAVPLGSWMAALIYRPQALVRHVRVDLSGAKTLMAQQLLYGSEIGPAVQEMGSEGVPQSMRRHRARTVGSRVSGQEMAHASGAKPPA